MAVPPARDRAAAGAGDARDDRGRAAAPLSRNPLYVGLLSLYLGLAMLAPMFWGLGLFPSAVLVVLWGAIYPEERLLHKQFGAPYAGYTRRVHRWL